MPFVARVILKFEGGSLFMTPTVLFTFPSTDVLSGTGTFFPKTFSKNRVFANIKDDEK